MALGRKTSIIMVLRIAGMLAGILSTAAVARYAGKQSFGLYVLIFSVLSLVMIVAQHAIPMYLAKNGAAYFRNGERELFEGVLNKGVSIYFISIGFALALLGGARVFIEIAGSLLLVLAATYAVLGLNIGLRGGLMTAIGEAQMGSPLEAVVRNAIFGVAVASWINKNSSVYDIFSLYFLGAVSSLFICLLLDKIFLGDVANHKCTVRISPVSWFDLSQIITFSLLGGVFVLNANIGVFFVGSMAGTEQVAVYKVAMLAATGVSFMFASSSSVLASRLSASVSKDVAGLARKMARLVTLLSVIALIMFVMLGEFFIGTMLGEEFLDAYSPSLILLAAQIVTAMFGFSGLYLNLNGDERFVLGTAVFAVSFNAVMHVLLVPGHSYMGAAWAVMATTIVWKFVLWVRLYYLQKVSMAIL